MDKTNTAIIDFITANTVATPPTIAEAIGKSASTVRRRLKALKEDGLVSDDGSKWSLVATEAEPEPTPEPSEATPESEPKAEAKPAPKAKKAAKAAKPQLKEAWAEVLGAIRKADAPMGATELAAALGRAGTYGPQAVTAACTALVKRGLVVKVATDGQVAYRAA